MRDRSEDLELGTPYVALQQSVVRSRKLLGAVICTFVAVFSWVTMGELLQTVETDYHKPFFLCWFVHSTYSFCLIPWLLWYLLVGRFRPKLPSRFPPSRFVIASCVLSILYFGAEYLWYISLNFTWVSLNTAITNTGCVFVFLFSVMLLGERVSGLKNAAIICCLVGVFLIAFDLPDGPDSSESSVFGLIMVVSATIFSALYEVLYQKMAVDQSSQENFADVFLIFGLMGLVSLFLAPGLLLVQFLGIESFQLPSRDLISLLLTTSVLDALYGLCTFYAILLSSPLFFSVGALLSIPAAIVLDILLYGRVLSVMAIFGVLLIVMAFGLMNYGELFSNHSQPSEETPKAM